MSRIFGLLLMSEGPVTLNALAEALEVSMGSVSTDARLTEFENDYATMISAICHALERHQGRPRRRVASLGRNP